MRRARGKIATLTLPVRPQHCKMLFITEQKRKHYQQISRKSSKKKLETTHSFNIVIDTVSFYEYYPHRNPEKSR